MAERRAFHVCDLCGEVDQDPRHRVMALPGTAFELPGNVDDLAAGILDRADVPAVERRDAIRELYDPTSQLAHMDCCAGSGRCDGSCERQLAAAGGNRERLHAHLLSEHERLNAEHAAAGRL